MNEYLFYDIEVFAYDALVVFKDHEKNVVEIFHNDFRGLAKLINGKTLVGFNNYFYDDKILAYMLGLKSVRQIKALNDQLIGGEEVKMIGKPQFKSLDTFQQIDTSMPSLKKIQGNYGRKILESSVPFSINRPLRPNEIKDVLDYCKSDVDTTVDIFKERFKSYFKPKFSLIEMLGNERAIKWNTTTISANLLLDKPLGKWSNLRVDEALLNYVPVEVKNMWLEKAQDFRGKVSKKSITIEAFDCEIQFGFGGLHGVHKRKKRIKNVKLLDVASMYPNIILLLNVLADATPKYRKILEQRLAVKHTDKILSDALKLILNSVYGNLNNKYSLLMNPNALLSVCAYGQIALYELCKRLHPFCTILNINTDGVAFIPEDDGYIAAYKEWEEEFRLSLEEKEFSELIQKDVNNYIAVTNKGLICKGGDVNRYEEDALFRNNNSRILDLALTEYLVNGKKIIETFEENLDKPHLFQYILKAGNTYLGTTDEGGEKEYNKVNRVFASKESGFCLFKQRYDKGLVRFADAPTSMFLWNDDCSKIKDFEKIIDLNHYYKIVEKRLERWE